MLESQEFRRVGGDTTGFDPPFKVAVFSVELVLVNPGRFGVGFEDGVAGSFGWGWSPLWAEAGFSGDAGWGGA
jgi:hypothetical protein